MLLSIDIRDSAKCVSVHGTLYTPKQPVLFVQQIRYRDTFVSHIRVAVLYLVLFVNQVVYTYILSFK